MRTPRSLRLGADHFRPGHEESLPMSHAAVLIRRCCIAMLLVSVLMPVSVAELYAQSTV